MIASACPADDRGTAEGVTEIETMFEKEELVFGIHQDDQVLPACALRTVSLIRSWRGRVRERNKKGGGFG